MHGLQGETCPNQDIAQDDRGGAASVTRLRIWGSGVRISSGAPLNPLARHRKAASARSRPYLAAAPNKEKPVPNRPTGRTSRLNFMNGAAIDRFSKNRNPSLRRYTIVTRHSDRVVFDIAP